MCGCGRGCARPRFALELSEVVPAVEKVIAKIGPLTKPESPGGFFALMDAKPDSI